jgi:hypothetical protein
VQNFIAILNIVLPQLGFARVAVLSRIRRVLKHLVAQNIESRERPHVAQIALWSRLGMRIWHGNDYVFGWGETDGLGHQTVEKQFD